jgi:hypothetical protein
VQGRFKSDELRYLVGEISKQSVWVAVWPILMVYYKMQEERNELKTKFITGCESFGGIFN